MPTELVKYDAARRALEIASTVDDAKSIKDKVAALQAYARQRGDVDMERWTAEIKLRAVRRIGELSKELDKAKNQYALLSGEESTKAKILKKANISLPSAQRCEQVAAIPQKEFDAYLNKKAKDKQPAKYTEAIRAIARPAKRRAQYPLVETFYTPEIRHCRMEELLTQLKDVDAIITDPPYGKEYLPLYEKLAVLAPAALAKNGVLAVMCGQSYLPEIFQLMCRHISYRWTMAYLTPGGQSPQIWDRKVNTFWKPVLIFGGRDAWIGDVANSDVNDNDKRFHQWGQAEIGMGRIIEKLSKPDDLICDPFLGGGTTALSAVALGRQFIGCDTDEKAIKTISERMKCQKLDAKEQVGGI